jgi:hypothetical protein
MKRIVLPASSIQRLPFRNILSLRSRGSTPPMIMPVPVPVAVTFHYPAGAVMSRVFQIGIDLQTEFVRINGTALALEFQRAQKSTVLLYCYSFESNLGGK